MISETGQFVCFVKKKIKTHEKNNHARKRYEKRPEAVVCIPH